MYLRGVCGAVELYGIVISSNLMYTNGVQKILQAPVIEHTGELPLLINDYLESESESALLVCEHTQGICFFLRSQCTEVNMNINLNITVQTFN